MANPYVDQLSAFRASIPNARRGLGDIFRLRGKHFASGDTELRKMIQAALGDQRGLNERGLAAIEGFGAAARGNVERYGYDLDTGQQGDVASIVGRAVNPLKTYNTQVGGAQLRYLNDALTANSGWYANMAEMLKREEPAAKAELEQGILDTSTNLQLQADQFTQQQAYNNQLQSYLGQLSAINGGAGAPDASGRNSSHTQSMINMIAQRWGITVGGWRAQGSVPNSDHPKGLAADAMIRSAAQGNQIAQFFAANAAAYAVKYIIWNRRIWSPGRGWRPYSGPSPHTDHVHISFLQ